MNYSIWKQNKDASYTVVFNDTYENHHTETIEWFATERNKREHIKQKIYKGATLHALTVMSTFLKLRY